jgi:hypothetical protein
MIVLKAAQEKFLGALQAVAGIVERRHTMPILANVLIRKNGPQIEFTTSDLEIQVRTSAELGGDAGSFSTTVGAKKLIDVLRSLPSDQIVTLSASQNKMTLQGGKSRFTLQTLPSDDFPLVQEAADFGPAFSSVQNRQRRRSSTQPARPAAVEAPQPGNALASPTPRLTQLPSIFRCGTSRQVLAILPPVGSGCVAPVPRHVAWRSTVLVRKPRFSPSFLHLLNELRRRSSHLPAAFRTAV